MKIRLTIDRFENGIAILKSDDNLAIEWPREKLPEESAEGSVLNFTINTDKEEEQEKKREAKDILNEILKIE